MLHILMHLVFPYLFIGVHIYTIVHVCSVTSYDRLTARTTSADSRTVLYLFHLPHDCMPFIVEKTAWHYNTVPCLSANVQMAW